ncbi:Imm1 family immunity protein [Kribbella sp. NPDC023972]|uniref:Imm1 family immunity protein n=1 Tax=Kribbella sp. NPDC023972 TaxID=3154795 RepID=UPI0033E726F3
MSVRIKAYYKHGHGDDPVILETPQDADALVDALTSEDFDNSVAALYAGTRARVNPDYPDHELRIAWFAEGKVGGIRYAGGDSKDVTYVQGKTSEREEVFYNYMHHDEGWPQDSEVGIEQVRQAVREFVEGNGSRPQSFEWRRWPQGVR